MAKILLRTGKRLEAARMFLIRASGRAYSVPLLGTAMILDRILLRRSRKRGSSPNTRCWITDRYGLSGTTLHFGCRTKRTSPSVQTANAPASGIQSPTSACLPLITGSKSGHPHDRLLRRLAHLQQQSITSIIEIKARLRWDLRLNWNGIPSRTPHKDRWF